MQPTTLRVCVGLIDYLKAPSDNLARIVSSMCMADKTTISGLVVNQIVEASKEFKAVHDGHR